MRFTPMLLLAAGCGGGPGGGGPAEPAAFVANHLAAALRVDAPPLDPPYAYSPTSCCDGITVHAVWDGYDYTPPEDYSCRYDRSEDRARTWLAADVRLDTDPLTRELDEARYPKICCDGAGIHIVWHDARNGGRDVWHRRSTDGGATWLPANLPVNATGLGPGNSDLAICCEGLRLHVVWSDRPNGGEDLFHRRSDDGGDTWVASDLRLDTDAPGAADSQGPRLCCEGRNLYAAWKDFRGGPDGETRFTWSTDGGVTRAASDLRLDGAVGGVDPDLDPCCDGVNVFVAWAGDLPGGDHAIYANASVP
jgi:hypothetical protein